LALLLLFVTACAAPAAPAGAATPTPLPDGAEPLSIVTTIFAPYDFARVITGGQAELTLLLPPGAESHSFEPTPQDILKIENCDLFVYVGGESEMWVERILESTGLPPSKTLSLLDCVSVVEEEIVEGMQDDEEHDHGGEEHTEEEHGEEHAGEEDHAEEEHEEEGHAEEEVVYDEHVWTSPKNAKLIAQRLSELLSAADGGNAAQYAANTASYLAELDDLDAKFRAVVDSAARNTVVFGDRFPFRYFADEYGLTYFAAFPGCSTESEPAPQTVTFLIDKIKEESIPVVYYIEMSNQRMADTIQEATGAEKRLLHACHNVSRDDMLAGRTYIELMTANVDALRAGLS
jgi:zinc transport system substrate-binding protein